MPSQFQTIADVSYTQINRIADASRAFEVDQKTASRCRLLTSHVSERSDAALMDHMMDSWRQHQPFFFVGLILLDCTTENLNLPMLGLEGEECLHQTRSSWHVMTSVQIFLRPLQGVGTPSDVPIGIADVITPPQRRSTRLRCRLPKVSCSSTRHSESGLLLD